MKKIFREPLVHFVLLGAAMFLLFAIVNTDSDDQDVIRIDTYDIDNIVASWEMQWKRLPTDEELKNLVHQNVRQEVFYQEALKMRLDHNDEIIKRRLAQKMEFLSNDLATLQDPTDEELKAYFLKNQDNYLVPARYSFYQVCFSVDGRSDPESDAAVLLKSTVKRQAEELKDKGDPIALPFFYDDLDARYLNRNLGMGFADKLNDLEQGTWQGPVQSGFGWHLVYIEQKEPSRVADFEDIRDELVRDLQYVNQKEMYEQVYRELKKNYRIEYELDPEKFDSGFVEYLSQDPND